jgi:hypothetical protein
MLDSGTASGPVITDHAPAIPHRIEERHEAPKADGSHRGESMAIRVDAMSVLGKTFLDGSGILADWRMCSSEPLDGAVGLDFFLDRRVTIAPPTSHHIFSMPEPESTDEMPSSISIPATTCPSSTRVFAEGLARSERPGRSKVFRKAVPPELAGHRFVLDDLREDPIRRGAGFDLPVALAIGGDVLSHFVVTIDIRARKLILALTE